MPQQDKIDLMKQFTGRIELKLRFPQHKLNTKREDTVTQVEPDISTTQTDSHTKNTVEAFTGLWLLVDGCRVPLHLCESSPRPRGLDAYECLICPIME